MSAFEAAADIAPDLEPQPTSASLHSAATRLRAHGRDVLRKEASEILLAAHETAEERDEENVTRGEMVKKYNSLARLMNDTDARDQLTGLVSHMRTVFLDEGKEVEGHNMQYNIDTLGVFLSLGDLLKSGSWPERADGLEAERLDALYQRFLKLQPRALSPNPAETQQMSLAARVEAGQWRRDWLESDIPPPDVSSPLTPEAGDAPRPQSRAKRQRTPSERGGSAGGSAALSRVRRVASKLQKAGFTDVASRLVQMHQKKPAKPKQVPRSAARRLLQEAGLILPNRKKAEEAAREEVVMPETASAAPASAGDKKDAPDGFGAWDQRLWEEVRKIALTEEDHVTCTKMISEIVLRATDVPWANMRQELDLWRRAAQAFKARYEEAQQELVQARLEAGEPKVSPSPKLQQMFYSGSDEAIRASDQLANLESQRIRTEESLQAMNAQLRVAELDLNRMKEDERRCRERLATLHRVQTGQRGRVGHLAGGRTRERGVQTGETDCWDGDGGYAAGASADSSDHDHMTSAFEAGRARGLPSQLAVVLLAACTVYSASGTMCPCGQSFLRKDAFFTTARHPVSSAAAKKRGRSPEKKKAGAASEKSRFLLDADAASPRSQASQENPAERTETDIPATVSSPLLLSPTKASQPKKSPKASGGRGRKTRRGSATPVTSRSPDKDKDKSAEDGKEGSAVEAQLSILEERKKTQADKSAKAVKKAVDALVEKVSKWLGSLASMLDATTKSHRQSHIAGLIAPVVAPDELLKQGEALKDRITEIVLSLCGSRSSEMLSPPGDVREPKKIKMELRNAAAELRKELMRVAQGARQASYMGSDPGSESVTGRSQHRQTMGTMGTAGSSPRMSARVSTRVSTAAPALRIEGPHQSSIGHGQVGLGLPIIPQPPSGGGHRGTLARGQGPRSAAAPRARHGSGLPAL
eukprot:TRINITY_DN70635_c0_g1_i1.p1 TRINITY_DN70635_c0_g1~~TRINITY_DN70635_c0_g1_i1.p1  ORF type:complete len:957 (+),score=186.46 TRINITY_DN70635_c0_g1_i1:86-2872(+)